MLTPSWEVLGVAEPLIADPLVEGGLAGVGRLDARPEEGRGTLRPITAA